LNKRSDIERWILGNLSPRRTTTAELAYERMESQSGECLAVLYQPLDHTRRMHWHDVAIVSAFARAMGDAGSVLDIGPGDGWPSLRMADRFSRIVGIDPSPKRVRVQQENAARLGILNVEFLVMDAEAMSFEDASFDGVCAASSIEQCDDPAAALAEVHRVLRPGGTLDELLGSTGFGEIKHLDHRIPLVHEAFDAAESDGRLDEYASTFVQVCEEIGARVVDDATPGQGSFVIARKPPR